MGEVVVISEGRTMELPTQETELEKQIPQPTENKAPQKTPEGGASAADGSTSSAVVRWERFLPKMAVRVLLVEADESTSQIIAALLRKCSYKVAAVSDGLKAWEVLKERSQNIDLILTEVELPLISGYALLTLIMEHDGCKNIPVIMMSSHDSVSTVYKCMLRGAADFLVKPVRKNELRNLWQHVWRRQVSRNATALGPLDESVAQQKIEATAENNAVSNHSSGYMACIQRNRECIEKGSDAQSSCTKPELENEGADIEHVHCLPQAKTPNCVPNDLIIYSKDAKIQVHDKEDGESRAVATVDANYVTTCGRDTDIDTGWQQVNANQTIEHNHAPDNSCRKAIDLIGAFDSTSKGNLISPASNASTNKFDICPQLDLSLRRSHPSSSVNQVNDENRRLNHSDASAFSRYIGKTLQSRNSTSPSTCNQQKDQETNSEKQQSNHVLDYNSDTHGPATTSFQPALHETPIPYPQHREISQPIPVRGVRFETLINGFSPVMPQMYRVPSGLSPLPSPSTASYARPFSQHNPFYPSDCQPSNSPKFNSSLDQRFGNTIDQKDNRHAQKLENLENQSRASCANEQTANSSFYNHYGVGPSGNGKIHAISLPMPMTQCGNEDGHHIQEGNSHRSTQREVALTKFRMKRKERCFEKKVRYESRKKLAEQRPRVKGQFVRQVPNDRPGSSSAA